MSDLTMNTVSTATTAPVTLESISEAMAKLKPMPRAVLVYPGLIAEFKADLAASGVEIRGAKPPDPGVPPMPFGLRPIDGLECWEVDGDVWIAGSYPDFQDARDGKIPFMWLKGRR